MGTGEQASKLNGVERTSQKLQILFQLGLHFGEVSSSCIGGELEERFRVPKTGLETFQLFDVSLDPVVRSRHLSRVIGVIPKIGGSHDVFEPFELDTELIDVQIARRSFESNAKHRNFCWWIGTVFFLAKRSSVVTSTHLSFTRVRRVTDGMRWPEMSLSMGNSKTKETMDGVRGEVTEARRD